MAPTPRMEDLVRYYKAQIERELGQRDYKPKASTREYKEFKSAYMPRHLTIYEKLCHISEKVLRLSPDKKKSAELLEQIQISHLEITPAGVTSFSYLAPLLIILVGSLVSFMLFQSNFFIFFFFIVGLIMIKPLAGLPEFFANSWRLKASNQMVLCVFYVVTFMRHTSNIENAIEFSADHLAPPLSLDLKKVLWDVETEKYESVKESLDMYLQTWKKWNFEFIESFHLIESSLYESSDARRLNALDKALDVILSETYEKMLHYAHNLQSPITMLHMLGVILPILGLVILPLVVSFMEGVRWYHIAALYNILLPIGVFYLGKNILSRRPTGYGQTDIAEENPELQKYKNVILKIGKSEVLINPVVFSFFIAGILLLIGLAPVLMHAFGVADFGFGAEELTSSCGQRYCMLDYRDVTEGTNVVNRGPYGLGAAILSLAVTLAIGVGLGLYFKLRSKNVIKIRERSKKLELEFAGALFQLGNRLGDGFPAEIAFGKVAEVMEGTISGSFFQLVSSNIRRLGMSIKQAVFDPHHGALVSFPSNLIESSMKVLMQSIKKGPRIAAQALTNVSRYIKEIHTVNERLKDLLSDIISSMQSQIKFLTPAIAGIVIGITSMVTTILGVLSDRLSDIGGSTGSASIPDLFGGVGIPTFYFQIIVGIYVVQITYILTVLVNGIENGDDKLNERYVLGTNLLRTTIMYVIISLIVMILFNTIALQIFEGISGV